MKTKKILIFIMATFFLLIPFLVYAALVPCGRDLNKNGVIDKNEECTLTCFYVMIDKVISFILWDIAAPLAATALMVSGIMFLWGGSEKTVSRGKAILSSTLIGLFLAFGAWLIIDMILRGLLGADWYAVWNEFPGECGN